MQSPTSPPASPPFDDFTARLIARKARKLAAGAGYTQQDQEDLEQELLAKLILASRSYTAERGHWRSFATTVVDRKASSLARRGMALKRHPYRVRSLNMVVEHRPGQFTELSERIQDDAHDRRLDRSTRSPYRSIELQIELEECLSELSAEQQQICERLKYSTVSQVARDMEVPRSTVQSRLREIYACFAQHGLREYLPDASLNGDASE